MDAARSKLGRFPSKIHTKCVEQRGQIAKKVISANFRDVNRLTHAGAYGGIDILVNNVGGGGGGGARIADRTDDDWRGALERNLVQTVRMMRLALPHMKDRSGPAVINVASISGWSPQLAMSGQYGAAKAALIFETERWAL